MKISFWDILKFLIKGKLSNMLHWGNSHLKASHFASFVSLAAILDFNENLLWGYSKILHQRKITGSASLR